MIQPIHPSLRSQNGVSFISVVVQEHLEVSIVRIRVALRTDQGAIQTNAKLFDQVMRQVVGHIHVIRSVNVVRGIGSFLEVQFNGEVASIQIHIIGHGLNDKFHRNETIRGGGNGDHAVPHVPDIRFRNPEQGQGSIPVSPGPSVCWLWF